MICLHLDEEDVRLLREAIDILHHTEGVLAYCQLQRGLLGHGPAVFQHHRDRRDRAHALREYLISTGERDSHAD